ncbi:carbamoyltransferase C-terminal domain-containing protein [Polyangium sp. y55x31]|uniref:carbamoyltransferase family protein n=1 Tax=Polyangium sp. y55x31 TaxID=3042688 RepID=UPI0024829A8E|nr:carbamoyltransferase C-terminal domain-containing protein [Polyangium sp. y55x31]MDI1475042.1 carbamoyltransferase C-terminal domain-containing protein [Polyangium sp. y55x31]
MYVLGINAAYHESAACLLKDGAIVAAIEEERLSRRKHGKAANLDDGHALPLLAIQYCLDVAGVTLGEVSCVGYSLEPHDRLRNKEIVEPVVPGGWGSPAGEQLFFDLALRVPAELRRLGMTGEFKWVPHHLAHAASAFHPSPFREAAILCVDGIGEVGSTLFASGCGSKIEALDEIRYPSSLGFLWEKLSKFLGFSEYDACQVMGLAAYGDPRRFRGSFERLVSFEPEGHFALDGGALRFRVEDYEPLEALFGVPLRKKSEPILAAHEDIAAALQEMTNQTIGHMVRHLAARTGSKNLCMAGGVALNCVSNRIVFEASPFEGLFVQPAAHDAGTALGAALHVWHDVLGHAERSPMLHPYVGPRFDDSAIERALSKTGVVYQREPNIEEKVAELLAAGKIVGWFQGAMEFGPRALGNRSLLADPRALEMKRRLNDRIKHRASFRPFAPSILAEEAERWFVIEKSTATSDFMLLAYPVRPDRMAQIPSVIHVDGTSRVQTVRAETNPRYHKLISAFYARTGVPMVLNTSFNDSEPIVCTPEHAIETFRSASIDVLAIGDCLVEASRQPRGEAEARALAPSAPGLSSRASASRV